MRSPGFRVTIAFFQWAERPAWAVRWRRSFPRTFKVLTCKTLVQFQLIRYDGLTVRSGSVAEAADWLSHNHKGLSCSRGSG